ncbi:ABC transporter ATP-binding protein [Patescibacteria group bacterium]|nr:ABC transporter ATP-binding protein [Patescibacteria group bacterium]MBU0963537.1 ABC transporter ATP-binding protein [Patescibacteria group bacterium]
MLDLLRVNKFFGENDDFEVLKDVSISAENGEFVCILGPSGCGKTILLYLIAGFLKPTEGKILMENASISEPNCNRMMIFQNYVLFPWKTVYKNILFALDKSTLTNSEKDALIVRYLDMMGLIAFRDWYPYKLSGGMQQRVALARALVANPKLLLMDEPFAALDLQHRKFLRKNLETIWQKTKKTIIFVTHSPNEAISLADKIYLLSARPAVIKKTYQIDLPRPRDSLNPDFIKLNIEIEKDLSEEFEKAIKNPLMEESLLHILNLTKKGEIL